MDSECSELTMKPPKDLYVGKSIIELDLKSKYFPSENIRRLPLLKLCKCCKKLYQKANDSLFLQDQEMAYIKLSRYFTIISLIQNNDEYPNHKETVTRMLGSTEHQLEAMDQLEYIKEQLIQRYAQKAELDSSWTGSMVKPRQTEISSFPQYKPCNEREYITCTELYDLFSAKYNSPAPKEVLFDCRTFVDYFDSHILHECCLNIDEEKIQPGVTAAQLASHFKPDSVEMAIWIYRTTADYVILYDWKTDTEQPIVDTPLYMLMGILKNWDPDVNYKSLKFLKGGYEEFLTLYPQFTTNPNVERPQIAREEPEICDIEYPSIDLIVMKDETLNVTVKQVPVVDRNTKPEALRKLNEISLKELIDTREKIVDRSLSLEKERHDVGLKIKDALSAIECATEGANKENLLKEITELDYTVLEIENSILDVAEESLTIQEEIEEGQACAPETESTINKLNEIECKENEAQHLHKLNESLVKENRLAQKQLSPCKAAPVVDRTSKPIVKPIDLQRNLNPVLIPPGEIGQRGITGLYNMGNTCYMNCIIQCLSNTNSLTQAFINLTYKKFINESGDTRGAVVETLANVVRALWCGKYKSIEPADFRKMIGQLHEPFGTNDQQDAHEFLVLLLDWLHQDLLKMPEQNSCLMSNNTAEMQWLNFTESNESLILDLFFGQIKSTVKCKTCNYESATYETFSNLSLELPKIRNRVHLDDCLKLYFSGEAICGWRCPKCGQARDAIKKLDISRLPSIVVIHLKRFEYNCDTNKFDKIRNNIQFPLGDVSFDKYLAPSELRNPKSISLNHKYRLYAVAFHYGEGIKSGHYVSCCLNSISKRWYKFNDTHVDPKNITDSSGAYILFYSRIEDSIPPEVHNLVY